MLSNPAMFIDFKFPSLLHAGFIGNVRSACVDHNHIAANGFHGGAQDKWAASYDVKAILLSIQSLLGGVALCAAGIAG